MVSVGIAGVFRHGKLKKALVLIAFCLGLSSMSPDAFALRAGRPAKPVSRTDLFLNNSLLGSYLAGRVARASSDSEAAAYYYRRALAKDPGNQDILDDTFELELAAGDFEAARGLAERLVKRQNDNTVAQIFLGLEDFKRRDYARADEHFKIAEKTSSSSEPTVKLARAWAAVASGRADKAIAALQAPSKAAWAAHFETVQRAFMADVAKKQVVARQAYQDVYDKNPAFRRIAEAFARHLAYWGDQAKAEKVLKDSGAAETPLGKQVLEDIKAGRKPKLMVSSAEEGLAESLLGIGQVLALNNGIDASQVYLRLALFLDPKSELTLLELAQLYAKIEKYDRAIAILEPIKETSPYWLDAKVRVALYLNALQKPDDAVSLLKTLLDKSPKDDQILQLLASIESARKKYEEAIPYYDRSIAQIGTPEKKDWEVFFNRGVAYERTKQWPKAEQDFKKSIELDPEQGAVLNYLGYSWLDQNMNVPEAFDLIKKAVKLRPNDGYIIDSLGWGYYIQKDYEEAVKNLDKAVELRPEDPTLNDHLGDCYWRLGRRLEAKYQWSQALSLKPEADEAEKIKQKLEAGLPDDAPNAPQARSSSAQVIGGSATETPSSNP